MKKYHFFLAILALSSAIGWTIEPPRPKLTVAAPGLPLTLNMDFADGNFLVQESLTLNDWHPFVHVFSRVSSFRLVDRSLSAMVRKEEPRFYRVGGNAQPPLEMKQAWANSGFKNYRFRFSRTCFNCKPLSLGGTVTVRDGKVVAVENAVDSGGGPITNPDLSEFRSIEELFDIVAQQTATADLVLVHLSESLPFPIWLHIDPRVGMEDEDITYWVSDVVRLD